MAGENEGHRARKIRTSLEDKMPKLAAEVGTSLHFSGNPTYQDLREVFEIWQVSRIISNENWLRHDFSGYAVTPLVDSLKP